MIYEASDNGEGTSGPTYKMGFLKAVNVLEPVLAIYENVRQVLSTAPDGTRQGFSEASLRDAGSH